MITNQVSVTFNKNEKHELKFYLTKIPTVIKLE